MQLIKVRTIQKISAHGLNGLISKGLFTKRYNNCEPPRNSVFKIRLPGLSKSDKDSYGRLTSADNFITKLPIELGYLYTGCPKKSTQLCISVAQLWN